LAPIIVDALFGSRRSLADPSLALTLPPSPSAAA
jgi:hypothetical protein